MTAGRFNAILRRTVRSMSLLVLISMFQHHTKQHTVSL